MDPKFKKNKIQFFLFVFICLSQFSYGQVSKSCQHDITLFNNAGSGIYYSVRVTANPGTSITASSVPAGWTQVANYPNSVEWFPAPSGSSIPYGNPLPNGFKISVQQNSTATQSVNVEWLDVSKKTLCTKALSVPCRKVIVSPTPDVLKKAFLNAVVYEPVNKTLRFNSKASMLRVYNIIDEYADDWGITDKDTTLVRPKLFDFFEKTYPGFVSFDKLVSTRIAKAESAGIQEPKTGFTYDEGFFDEIINLFINKDKCFKIGNQLFRFIDFKTMIEVNNPSNKQEIYNMVVKAVDPKSLHLQGLKVHNLRKGKVWYADQNREDPAVDYLTTDPGSSGQPCDLVGAYADFLEPLQEETDKEGDINFDMSYPGCLSYQFTGLSMVEEDINPTYVSYMYSLYSLDPMTGSSTLVATSPNTLNWNYHFSQSGEYMVKLDMWGGGLTDTVSTYRQFAVSALTVDFSFSNPDACDPKRYIFDPSLSVSDTSCGSITGYTWNVYTGTDTTGVPIFTSGSVLFDYTFPNDGAFTVCLQLISSNGCQAESCQKIIVSSEARADFIQNFSVCSDDDCANASVHFTSTSTGGACPLTYAWDFGDGNTDNVASPTHIYAGCGSYQVTLKVTDANGISNTIIKQVNIQPLNATFTFIICPNGRVTFLASQKPASVDFGGGDDGFFKTFNFLFPRKQIAFYDAPGVYLITMTFKDSSGNQCTVKKELVINDIVCCEKNKGRHSVATSGDYKAKGHFGHTDLLFIHRVKAKTTLRKKGFLNIYYLCKAKTIEAGWEGSYHTANGNWWQVNIERTSCNCVNNIPYPYTSTTESNKSKAKITESVGNSFAFRLQEAHSTHKVVTKDNTTLNPASIYLGVDCDDNN